MNILCRKVARWASDNLERLRNAEPDPPEELNDRAADNWEPLIAIADLAGGPWPERSRQAALALRGIDEASNSALIQLLADLRDLFEPVEHRDNVECDDLNCRDSSHHNRVGQADRMSSAEIVKTLGEMEDRPWPEWRRGKPITVRQLARLLEPLYIRPRQVWIDGGNVQGYRREWFDTPFTIYLPSDPLGPLGSLEPVKNTGESSKFDPLGREWT